MHTIKFKIDEEKDLYNPFDVDGILLSEDVKNYISGQLTSRKIGDHVEISIVSSKESFERICFNSFGCLE